MKLEDIVGNIIQRYSPNPWLDMEAINDILQYENLSKKGKLEIFGFWGSRWEDIVE